MTHNIECLGFKINEMGTTPLIHKSDAIRILKEPRSIKDIRLIMGSINQFNKFVPKLASLSAPFRELMQKNYLIGLRYTLRRSKKSRKKSAIL